MAGAGAGVTVGANGERAMKCRHCQVVEANRPRGLCWSCYYTPGIRSRYPSTSIYARRGLDDFYGAGAMPVGPTRALPGSQEKVQVLMDRARRRQTLWHPGDAPMDAESRRLGVA